MSKFSISAALLSLVLCFMGSSYLSFPRISAQGVCGPYQGSPACATAWKLSPQCKTGPLVVSPNLFSILRNHCSWLFNVQLLENHCFASCILFLILFLQEGE